MSSIISNVEAAKHTGASTCLPKKSKAIGLESLYTRKRQIGRGSIGDLNDVNAGFESSIKYGEDVAN